jgi:hypothetical protein
MYHKVRRATESSKSLLKNIDMINPTELINFCLLNLVSVLGDRVMECALNTDIFDLLKNLMLIAF